MHLSYFTKAYIQSRVFYDTRRVLLAEARSFQALAVILDRHNWPRTHAGNDPMRDKMNLDHLKLFYCEFQKYEVMTMSVVSGQPKKKNTPIPLIKPQNTSHVLFQSDYYTSSVLVVVSVVKCCGILYQVEISKAEFC